MPSISPEEDELELLQLDYMADRLGQLHNHLRKVSKGKWFHTKQMEVITEIFQKGKKRVFARKGRKGGGTHISLYPGVRLAGLFPNVGGYLIYPTLTLGKEIVWANNRLKNYFPPEWDCYSKENECRIVIPHTDGDSFVRVLGADNYKQMVGIEGDFFIFDELKDHDPRAYKNCYPNIASRDALWMVLGAPPKNKKNFYYITEQAAMKTPLIYQAAKSGYKPKKMLTTLAVIGMSGKLSGKPDMFWAVREQLYQRLIKQSTQYHMMLLKPGYCKIRKNFVGIRYSILGTQRVFT